MSGRRLRAHASIGTLAVLALGAAQPGVWTIGARPEVVIGNSDADTASLESVAGATRLPDGRIVVGDLGAYALRVFSASGRSLSSFGRRGAGPGEIALLRDMLRCGDSLFAADVDNGNRVSAFTLDGKYVRAFRFASPEVVSPPYTSVCNATGTFGHYGWGSRRDAKPGVHRSLTPYWFSGADSAVRRVIGEFPGSERFGYVVRGHFAGTRPLPLGAQPVIAIGRGRFYVGTADRTEIDVFDFSARRLPPISLGNARPRRTDADVAYAVDLATAGRPDSVRRRLAAAHADLPLPEELPPYAQLIVDGDDLLWVKDYPRPASAAVRWSVFDATGRRVAEVALPTHLTVTEIGRDYVLGSYLDPEAAIPEVRLYRLTRRGTR